MSEQGDRGNRRRPASLHEIFELCKKGLLHPEAEPVARMRIKWQLFSGLSFKSNAPIAQHRRRFHIILFEISDMFRIRPRELQWVLRRERHKSGDPHFHFILAGMPKDRLPADLPEQLSAIWEAHHGGICEIAFFDPNRCGFEYIFKIDPYSDDSESVNWDRATEIVLSHSLSGHKP